MADKTMKQIADFLGCPKIKVYRYIKANHINATYQEGNRQYFDETVADSIITALRNMEDDTENVSETLQNDTKNALETVQNVTEILTKQLEVKDGQLAEKDKQIAALTEQVAALTSALENTTASLQAAQALNAADKQQLMLMQAEQAEKALPFWKRLFKKREQEQETAGGDEN